ncbi:MAG: chemotaxis response regulator protein-glutamate methylesterase [Calditrichia bacterium]
MAIKILVVEDSLISQNLLKKLFSGTADMEVFGVADNGRKALDFLQNASELPDVVTMDLNMPVMDGFTVIPKILEKYALPIVVISSFWEPSQIEMTEKLMSMGVCAILQKPQRHFTRGDLHYILEVIRKAAKTKVQVRPAFTSSKKSAPKQIPQNKLIDIELVAIGCSTGGPPVLYKLLTALPQDFPCPILIVQHIAPAFTANMVEWLNEKARVRVKIAEYGEQMIPGTVYFAPGDFHLGVSSQGFLLTSKAPPEGGLRPSVNYLFQSLLKYQPDKTLAILLTGMGRDGADGLKALKEAGAFTVIQNRETSTVYGMPGEAKKLHAELLELSDNQILELLLKLTKRTEKKNAQNSGC